MTEDVNAIVTELVQLGYTVTYLGKGLGKYNQRLMITGDLYQAEITCNTDELYKLRYKIFPPTNDNNINKGLVFDEDSLDDLRELLEPNIQTLLAWVEESEPFVYVLNEQSNTVKNIT